MLFVPHKHFVLLSYFMLVLYFMLVSYSILRHAWARMHRCLLGVWWHVVDEKESAVNNTSGASCFKVHGPKCRTFKGERHFAVAIFPFVNGRCHLKQLLPFLKQSLPFITVVAISIHAGSDKNAGVHEKRWISTYFRITFSCPLSSDIRSIDSKNGGRTTTAVDGGTKRKFLKKPTGLRPFFSVNE